MSFGPLSVGDGRPSHHTFTTDSGIFLLTGLSNNAIALHMEDINNNYALYICTGAWNITNVGSAGPPVVPATADFTPSVQDLQSTNPFGKAGLCRTYPVVTLSTGPVAMDSQTIQVLNTI